jgi:hypothetical protein
MEALSSLSTNKRQIITLDGILPDVRQLPSYDKLRLIRILAEELENNKNIFPFKQGRIYSLPTPYDTFGAGEILMKALKTSDTDKSP